MRRYHTHKNIFRTVPKIMLNNAIYAQISGIKFLIKIMDFPRYTQQHSKYAKILFLWFTILKAKRRQILGEIPWKYIETIKIWKKNRIFNMTFYTVRCPLGQNSIKLPFRKSQSMVLRVQLASLNIFHFGVIWKFFGTICCRLRHCMTH